MKKCSKCKIEYEFDQFYVNRCRPDGRAAQCRMCSQASQRKRRNKYIGRFYYQKNKNKAKARDAARRHYRKDGEFDCSVLTCESKAEELHHVNYDEPLAVIPLCRKHHKMNHDVS